MTEKKTTLPSLMNQDWKKVKAETEKVNKLLPYIPSGNITKRKVGAKLVCILLRNSNRNIKPG